MSINYAELSKEISYALRHAPWEYELELDAEGFVPIEQLLASLNESSQYERDIVQTDLEHIIETSEKKRHEIAGDKIRALYGHSVPQMIQKIPGTPPAILYHGTTHKAITTIMSEGLKPMQRQYVHLSVDTDMATQVGKRRDSVPIILQIDTAKAIASGTKFYIGNDKVWLCDFVKKEAII